MLVALDSNAGFFLKENLYKKKTEFDYDALTYSWLEDALVWQ